MGWRSARPDALWRARYLVIATAGNRRLNADFDPLERRDRNDLARAKADLRDAAATERLFSQYGGGASAGLGTSGHDGIVTAAALT